MQRTETPYSTKEVVANLSIGDSTLRKWCLALEEQNYNFIRTDQNKRLFTDKDLLVLTQFRVLVQDKNMSINNAAAVVAAKYVKEPFSNETEVEQLPSPPFVNETLQELKTEMEQIKEMNRLLLSRLDEQHKYIEKRLDERDQLLMQSIRTSQETKKLLLEAQAKQEEEQQQKKPRRGLFKWFSKD